MTENNYEQLLRRSLAKIETLEAELANRATTSEPIAVIGMSCRFAGARDVQEFRELLKSSRDALREVPRDRWDIEEYYHPERGKAGKMYTRTGYFLDGVAEFDPGLFSISNREAAYMDPQQRLLLQGAWDAIENAGVSLKTLSREQTGTYVAAMNYDYSQIVANVESPDLHASTGTSPSALSGRISYSLGLRGPSITVDTACSSSLVALHLACRALQNREVNYGLVGGVNLQLTAYGTVMECASLMLAADGRCKAYDESADGFGRGDGCGVVLLKRLSDAVRDRDHVLSVIRGTAVNHDGEGGGLSVPNGKAQEELIRTVLARANVVADEVDFVEGHGTGTKLGDPIEVQALDNVFKTARRDTPLYLGAVKTNVGHTEAAAGIAGLIKAILMCQFDELLPNRHLQAPSSRIPWGKMNFRFPVTGDRKARADKPLLTCVNSFGLSGTNGSAVVEQFVPPTPSDTPVEQQQMLCLSAQSPHALRQLAERHIAQLSRGPVRLQDYCFTANTSRAQLRQRAAVSARTQDELLQKLMAVSTTEFGRPGSRPQQVLLFESDGPACALPGQWLLGRSAAFARALELAAPAYADVCRVQLRDVLFGKPALRQPQHWLPALFVYQYALSKALAELGVEPDVIAGNGVGRCTAAVLAGMLDFATGLKLAAALGSVRSSQATDQAAAVRLEEALANLVLATPDTPLIQSGNSGSTRELARTTHFVAELLRSEAQPWRPRAVEPGRPTLVIQCAPSTASSIEADAAPSSVLTTIRLFERGTDEQADWLAALGVLFENGFDLEFSRYYSGLACTRLAIPSYPFQQKPHWVPASASGATSRWSFAEPLKRGTQRRGVHKLSLPDGSEARYELALDARKDQFIREHRLGERCVLAGSMQMAFLFEVFSLEHPGRAIRLHDLVLLKPMLVGDDDELILHARVVHQGDRFETKLYASTRPTEGWQHISTTSVEVLPDGTDERLDLDRSAIERTWERTTPAVDLYTGIRSLGYQLGDSYCWLTDGWFRGPQVLRGLTKLPGVEPALTSVHPGLLDSAMQSVESSGASNNLETERGHIYVPLMVKSLTLYHRPDSAAQSWVHSELLATQDPTNVSREAHVTIFDDERRVIAKWDRIEYRPLVLGDLDRAPDAPGPYYRLRWLPFTAPGAPANRLDAILVFTTAEPATVREQLRTLAQEVIVVRLREHHRRHDRLTFDSGGVLDLDKLEAALSRDFPRVDAIYYDARDTSHGDYDAALERNFYYPLQVIALLGRAESTVKEFVFITAESQAVLGNETIGNPYAAMQWSLARTARNEYPAVAFRVLDTSPGAEIGLLAQLRGLLIQGDEFALRGEQLYVPTLASLTLPTEPRTLDATGHYLVTGGTRGVGLLACRALQTLGARRFLIAARNVDDEIRSAVRTALAATDVELEFVSVDLSDPSQVRRQLRPLLERISLKGIVHAAGQQTPQRIASFDAARGRKDLDSKVLSLLTIQGLVDPARLDFILCTSSISALFGTPGAATYSAANAFLDAHMQSLTPKTPGARSVQFGAWSEVGMFAALSQREREQFESAGVLPIANEQGSELLLDALKSSLPNYMAANFDWPKLLAAQPNAPQQDRFAEFRHLQAIAGPDSAAPVSAVAPDTNLRTWTNLRIEERIPWLNSFYCELVARACQLEVSMISPTESMSRFGIDSVVALEIRKAVQDFCGLELSIPAILDNGTIAGLVETTHDFIVDGNPKLFSKKKWLSLDRQQQRDWLSTFYVDLVARVCQLEPEQLTPSESMTRYGLDSVMAVEIRRAAQQFCDFELAITDILDDATIDTMIEKTRRFIDESTEHRHSVEGLQ